MASSSPKTLETLEFDCRSLRELPVDPIKENYTRQVSGAIFSRVDPTPVEKPVMVAYSAPALSLLGLPASEAERADAAEYFSGNKLLPGAQPAAHCYCGHQFGAFSGQLGDGATMYLGEVMAPSTGARTELQFKGAGKTPYSRTADGRKVLRSSIREFLCSELMWSLGVPTTRAGTIVTSDTKVVRDVFYTGDAIQERATIITRLAPTFLRFGSFEIFKTRDAMTGRSGPSVGQYALLRRLMEFTCRCYYPSIHAAHPTDAEAPQRFLAMYKEIARRSARLVATWQGVGWAHGVLNTDNMSVIGATIDYGPYGWLDRFDREFIPNTSDDGGRYSYDNQPWAVRWNVARLGEAFQPVFEGKGAPAPAAGAAAAGASASGEAADSSASASVAADGTSTTTTTPGSAIDWRPVLSDVFDYEYKRAYEELWRRKLGLGFAKAAADKAGKTAAAAAAASSSSTTMDADASASSSSGSDSGSGSGSGPTPPAYSHQRGFECAAEVVINMPPGDASASASGGPEGGILSADDLTLVMDLQETMQTTGADFTNTFRALMSVDPLGADTTAATAATGATGAADSGSGGGGGSSDPVLSYILTQTASAAEMAAALAPSLPREQLMLYLTLAQQGHPRFASHLDTLQGELAKYAAHDAAAARSDEEKKVADAAAWGAWLTRYRARLASEVPPEVRAAPGDHHAAVRALVSARYIMMAGANPKYVLRNWIAQAAIEKAEAGDFTAVRRVLARMMDPYGVGDDDHRPSLALAADDALTTSHVAALNMAAEGASALAHACPAATAAVAGGSGSGSGGGGGGGTCGIKGKGKGAAAAAGGGSGGGCESHLPDLLADDAAFARRPPPSALELKVT